jgi:hypothetical protein
VKKGILLVTGSDAGGITKVGAEWKNYILKFCDKRGKNARCTLKNEQRQHNKPAKSAIG